MSGIFCEQDISKGLDARASCLGYYLGLRVSKWFGAECFTSTMPVNVYLSTKKKSYCFVRFSNFRRLQATIASQFKSVPLEC